MSKPQARFRFSFTHETVDDFETETIFIIKMASVKPWNTWSYDNEDDYLDAIDQTEVYGVHDFSGNGSLMYPEADIYIVGFHSYEVHPDKWDEVMKHWHGVLSKIGAEPGEVERYNSLAEYQAAYPDDQG